MAQGKHEKLKKKSVSGGALKKKAVSKITLSKGKRNFTAKGRKATSSEDAITKSINKKNETLVSCRAVSSGSKFFLSDICESGLKELEKQQKHREKKESGSKNLDLRLKGQLKALGTTHV